MQDKKITEAYEEYFKEDLDAIEEELEKSKQYSAIIDKEINKLSEPGLTNKGGQHYLIEHIQNAVQLQTQRQGLRKDRFNIKKTIMDYAKRDNSGDENSTKELLESINKLIKSNDSLVQVEVKDENVDDEIDKILNQEENGN